METLLTFRICTLTLKEISTNEGMKLSAPRLFPLASSFWMESIFKQLGADLGMIPLTLVPFLTFFLPRETILAYTLPVMFADLFSLGRGSIWDTRVA